MAKDNKVVNVCITIEEESLKVLETIKEEEILTNNNRMFLKLGPLNN